jgi:hypothetical protein
MNENLRDAPISMVNFARNSLNLRQTCSSYCIQYSITVLLLEQRSIQDHYILEITKDDWIPAWNHLRRIIPVATASAAASLCGLFVASTAAWCARRAAAKSSLLTCPSL